MMNFLFSGKGRIRRRSMWLFLVAYWAAHAAAHLVDHALGWTAHMDDAGPLMTIVTLVSVWPSIAVSAKRFHDRGMSGWWVLWFALLSAIPLCVLIFTHADTLMGLEKGAFEPSMISPLGYAMVAVAALAQLVQFVILFILPGDKGENRYGPDPRAA